jgi:hypothetical protein
LTGTGDGLPLPDIELTVRSTQTPQLAERVGRAEFDLDADLLVPSFSIQTCTHVASVADLLAAVK